MQEEMDLVSVTGVQCFFANLKFSNKPEMKA